MGTLNQGSSGHGKGARSYNEAGLLLAISDRLAQTATLFEGVSTIINIAKAELDAELGSLFFNDPKTNELFFFLSDDPDTDAVRIPNDSGIAGYVFKTGQAEIIDDPYADERFNRSVDMQTGLVTRSIMCVPLTSGRGETIGVAELLNKRSGHFTIDDLALFMKMILIGMLALKGAHFPEMRAGARAKASHFAEPLMRKRGR